LGFENILFERKYRGCVYMICLYAQKLIIRKACPTSGGHSEKQSEPAVDRG
jgi:hypothetical protein